MSYARSHPSVINYVTAKARVFVSGRRRTTCPEPDIAAYRDFPLADLPQVRWEDVSPMLVVEVLGGEDDQKDLVRNVALYLQVPTIPSLSKEMACSNRPANTGEGASPSSAAPRTRAASALAVVAAFP